MLTVIGGKWYVNNINEKLPLLKKPRFIKEQQAKEDYIKVNLSILDYHFDGCKFHFLRILWNW